MIQIRLNRTYVTYAIVALLVLAIALDAYAVGVRRQLPKLHRAQAQATQARKALAYTNARRVIEQAQRTAIMAESTEYGRNANLELFHALGVEYPKLVKWYDFKACKAEDDVSVLGNCVNYW